MPKRCIEPSAGHRIGGDGDDAAARFDGGNRSGEIGDFAGVVRILEQRAENFLLRGFFRQTENEFKAEKAGAGFQYVDRLREAIFVDKKQIRF